MPLAESYDADHRSGRFLSWARGGGVGGVEMDDINKVQSDGNRMSEACCSV